MDENSRSAMERRLRASFVFVGCAFIAAANGHAQSAAENGLLGSSFGASISYAPASSGPGGIIKASLNKGGSVRRVALRFLGKEYTLGKPEDGLEPFALLGIDLDVKPGLLSLDAVFETDGGEKEEIRKEVPIHPKQFPVKRIRVSKAFSEPPPHVRERIQKEAELLREVYGRTTPRWLGEGSFMKPHPASLVPSFGERRVYGGNSPLSIHQGIDLAVPKGDPIRSSNSGRVVWAAETYLSGNTAVIDHGLGLFTVYCHMSRLMVRTGDTVKKGDTLGYCGSTGRSTGPHLHWGARLGESRVDPTLLLGLSLD